MLEMEVHVRMESMNSRVCAVVDSQNRDAKQTPMNVILIDV
jgi:hypothetical protein